MVWLYSVLTQSKALKTPGTLNSRPSTLKGFQMNDYIRGGKSGESVENDAVDVTSDTVNKSGEENPNVQPSSGKPNSIRYDPSPKRLVRSKVALDRTPTCKIQKPIDDISYAVAQKIRKGILEQEEQEQQKLLLFQKDSATSNASQPRILCLVYTHEGSHKTYLQAVVDTWAMQCDGFIAVSNVTDPHLGAITLNFPGAESYGNMWQKIIAMWMYTYEHYFNDFDYFHICGDDNFLLPNNLRRYLMGEQINSLLNGQLDAFSRMNGRAARWRNVRNRPLLLGFSTHKVKNGVAEQYPGGGSGYTLNRAALQIFHDHMLEYPSNRTDSREDVLMAGALGEYGITCSDTRDKYGAFRYTPDNPLSDYGKMHRRQKVKVENKFGLDKFSSETVAIHLNYRKKVHYFSQYTEEVLYRFGDLLTGACDKELLGYEVDHNRLELLASIQSTKRFRKRKARLLEKELGLPEGFLD